MITVLVFLQHCDKILRRSNMWEDRFILTQSFRQISVLYRREIMALESGTEVQFVVAGRYGDAIHIMEEQKSKSTGRSQRLDDMQRFMLNSLFLPTPLLKGSMDFNRASFLHILPHHLEEFSSNPSTQLSCSCFTTLG